MAHLIHPIPIDPDTANFTLRGKSNQPPARRFFSRRFLFLVAETRRWLFCGLGTSATTGRPSARGRTDALGT